MAEREITEKSNDPKDQSAESIHHIAEEVRLFTKSWLGFSPLLIDVDYHQQALTVSMEGILAEAEKDASKHKGISELIIKNHISAYKSVRTVLEARVAEFSGRLITGSALMLDPETNCATLHFKFDNPT